MVLAAATVTACGTEATANHTAPTYVVLAESYSREVPGLGSVLDLEVSKVAGSHRVWLLTNTSSPLTIVNDTAGEISSRGTRGRGPGDVAFPWGFAAPATTQGPPPVVDIGMRKVVQLADSALPRARLIAALSPLSVVRNFRDVHLGTPRNLVQVGSRFVWNEPTHSVSSSRDLWPLQIFSSDTAAHSTRVDTIFRWPVPLELESEPARQIYIPVPLSARCNDSTFVVFLNEPDSLMWVTPLGTVRDRAVSGLPRDSIKAAERLTYIRERMTMENRAQGTLLSASSLEQAASDGAARGQNYFATRGPRASTLLCGEDETVVLFRFVPSPEAHNVGTTARIVRRDSPPADVHFPTGILPLRLRYGAVWGIDDRALNGARVVAVPIPSAR